MDVTKVAATGRVHNHWFQHKVVTIDQYNDSNPYTLLPLNSKYSAASPHSILFKSMNIDILQDEFLPLSLNKVLTLCDYPCQKL